MSRSRRVLPRRTCARSRNSTSRNSLSTRSTAPWLAAGAPGALASQRGAAATAASGNLRIAAADLAELIRGGPPPLAGRLTVSVKLEGTGRSPVALIGSLKGGGTFTVQEAQIQRLDPG